MLTAEKQALILGVVMRFKKYFAQCLCLCLTSIVNINYINKQWSGLDGISEQPKIFRKIVTSAIWKTNPHAKKENPHPQVTNHLQFFLFLSMREGKQ